VRAPASLLAYATLGQFQVDGVNAGAAVSCDSSGLASFSSSTLTRGLHTITAIYSSGFSNVIGGNTQTMQVNVQGVPSQTVLSTSASSSIYGQSASITAHVTNTADATATAPGTVQFLVDGVSYGTPVILASGQATISLPAMLAAGNHQVTATYTGDSTLDGSEASALTQNVDQAIATINVSSYSVAYDGAAHTATGVAQGFDGSILSGLVLSGTTHTNAGTTTDTWTFHDPSGNYQDASGTIVNTISQATPSITITPYTTTYDGGAHTATGTATGVGGIDLSSYLILNLTTHTNAGVYSGDIWSFHELTGNYADVSGTVDNSIAKATATITVTPTPTMTPPTIRFSLMTSFL
jgi:hypothetical protein